MVSQSDLAAQYRTQQLRLRAVTARDAAHLWRLLDLHDIRGTYPAWASAHATLIERDRARMAALAARYVREAATLAGVEATIIPAEALAADLLAISQRATVLAPIFRALNASMTAEAASRAGLAAMIGSTTRHTLNAGRDVARRSVLASGGRWTRLAGGSACTFCRLLAGRDDYRTSESADFDAHDHCACSVAAHF